MILQKKTCAALGNAWRALGNTPKAIDYFERSLKSARELENHFGQAANLANLGIIYHQLGESHKALEFFEQSRLKAQSIGDRRLEANTLWNAAVVFEKLNNMVKAVENAEAALMLFQELEDPNAVMVGERLAKWRLASRAGDAVQNKVV